MWYYVDTIGKHSKISSEICEFYIYKISPKIKQNFDLPNAVIKTLEQCIEFVPSDQERGQDNTLNLLNSFMMEAVIIQKPAH